MTQEGTLMGWGKLCLGERVDLLTHYAPLTLSAGPTSSSYSD